MTISIKRAITKHVAKFIMMKCVINIRRKKMKIEIAILIFLVVILTIQLKNIEQKLYKLIELNTPQAINVINKNFELEK